MYKLICIAGLFLITQNVLSQQGPIIVCHDCDGLESRPLPVSGSWYNPQQPGSGYQFDIQNGYLLGYYYGYDENGTSVWRIFQNPLVESDEPGVLWEVTASFQKYSGGNVVNEPYQLPTGETTNSEINLKFRFKHYAHVSIDGGETQNIIPINFRVHASREFPESEQFFPELEGVWSYVFKSTEPAIFPYTSEAIFISNKATINSEDGTKIIEYWFERAYGPVETILYASLVCSNPVNNLTGNREVTCYIDFESERLDRMVVAPGDIGPNYIFGQNENGNTFEAIRYNYLPNYGRLEEPEPEDE